MKLFKTKIEKLKDKISDKNLLLLVASERNSEYFLEKLLAWQEEFDWVEWEEFYESWQYCNRCKSYAEGQCICYAR